MARARNIKPAFFTNDELVELPFETRLLFIGLWMLADREGRMVDRPKKIKMEIFPADDVDCEKSLSMLVTGGFIARYEFGAHKVIEIVNFIKHQAPHSTEKDSALPNRQGYFTVNRRTANGGVTGKPVFLLEGETENNVKEPLSNENQQPNNALIPECGTLTADCGLLTAEPGTLTPEQPIVERRDAPIDRDRVPDIFAYWQRVMDSPNSKLDKKRIDRIRNGLKLGYSVRQLCDAIRGCSRSPFNMGENDRNTKFNGLSLILRDAEHIDKFIALADQNVVGPETMSQRNARIIAELCDDEALDDPNIIDMED